MCLLWRPAFIIKFPSNEAVACTFSTSPLLRYRWNGCHTQIIPFKETTSAPYNEPECHQTCFRVHHGMRSKQDAGRLIYLSIFMYSSYYNSFIYCPCTLNRYITIRVSPAVTLKKILILPHAYAIYIYVICINLKISTDFFPKQYWPTGAYCLWGRTCQCSEG